MQDNLYNKITGHVLIRDIQSQEILVNKYNAINFENFSVCLAAGAAYQPEGYIYEMVFGNGAAIITGTGSISYLPPNVVGMNAQLYNQTYSQVINNISAANPDPNNNFIRINHRPGNFYTDVIVTCLLANNVPVNQDAFDTATDMTNAYMFNELGLKTKSSSITGGLLICHLVHNPVQKSLNREIEVIYTIRIQSV
jgi:hypothetical protein